MGSEHAAVAGDAPLVAHGLGQGRAQADAHVLHRVMAAGLQVAGRLDLEVEEAVAGYQLQHVVEEAQAGGDGRLARAVEVEFDRDVGLPGLALDGGHRG